MKILLVCKSKAMENLGVMYLAGVANAVPGNKVRIVAADEAVTIAAFWEPDMIGFSVMTGDQALMLHKSRLIKQSWKVGKKDPLTVFGGPHPTFFPDDFKDNEFVDVCIPGEAENWLSLYLGGSGYVMSDLDSLPFPDRTDFPNMVIRDFITSRGCPFSCRYCFNKKWRELYPGAVRFRAVDRVVDEIVAFGSEKFNYFQDSCFGVSKSWLRRFSDEYRKRVGVPFHCHLRPSQVDAETVTLLKHAGCWSVRMALETGVPRLKELIGRGNSNNNETHLATELLRDAEIQVMLQNMLAIPTSTIEDDLATLKVNIDCNPSYSWASIFAPFPGTELGDECKKKGWYTGDYSDITDCFFDTSVLEFSPEYKQQTYCLQKVFALCVEAWYVPDPSELTLDNLPKLTHKLMRIVGDHRLYGGVI